MSWVCWVCVGFSDGVCVDFELGLGWGFYGFGCFWDRFSDGNKLYMVVATTGASIWVFGFDFFFSCLKVCKLTRATVCIYICNLVFVHFERHTALSIVQNFPRAQ